MSVTSTRKIQIDYSGDVKGSQLLSAASNTNSPGDLTPISLTTGANTVVAPIISPIQPTAITIIPPAGNTNALTIKGSTTDTGIRIHNTDPTSLGVDSSVTSFVIDAAAPTVVRVMWS